MAIQPTVQQPETVQKYSHLLKRSWSVSEVTIAVDSHLDSLQAWQCLCMIKKEALLLMNPPRLMGRSAVLANVERVSLWQATVEGSR